MTDPQTDYETYRASVPRFDDWSEASCVGFFGYANGRGAIFGKAVADATGRPQPTPCNGCPENQKCWEGLKLRAREVFPALVDAFEEMAEVVKGPELMKRWSEKMGRDGKGFADPYSYVMLTNMEVGILHAHGESPSE